MDGAMVLIPIVTSIGFFTMVVMIVWAATYAKNKRTAMQTEVQTRLIDKFSNAPEFVEFLNSDTGKQFLTGIDKMPQLMARDRIVGGVSRGVIMMLLGLAFIAIWIADSNIGFMYPGFILMGLGIGFFISTLVSLKMSQKFGLIGNDTPSPREVIHHTSETQA
jgi:hypothetical protein